MITDNRTLKLLGVVAVLSTAACRDEDPRHTNPLVPTTAPVQGTAPLPGAQPGQASNAGASSGPEVSMNNPLTPAAGNSPASGGATALGAGGAPANAGGAPTTAAVRAGGTPPSGAESAAQTSELLAPLTDEQIAKIADGLNSGEIEQAKLAQSKGQNAQVKGFALMMLDHHGQANRQLEALKTDKADSPLAQKLAQESQRTAAALQQAANGSDFDRAYVQAQLDGHQSALATVQQRLLPEAKGAALKGYLSSLESRIRQHLERARSIQSALAGAAAPSAAPAGSPSR